MKNLENRAFCKARFHKIENAGKPEFANSKTDEFQNSEKARTQKKQEHRKARTLKLQSSYNSTADQRLFQIGQRKYP